MKKLLNIILITILVVGCGSIFKKKEDKKVYSFHISLVRPKGGSIYYGKPWELSLTPRGYYGKVIINEKNISTKCSYGTMEEKVKKEYQEALENGVVEIRCLQEPDQKRKEDDSYIRQYTRPLCPYRRESRYFYGEEGFYRVFKEHVLRNRGAVEVLPGGGELVIKSGCKPWEFEREIAANSLPDPSSPTVIAVEAKDGSLKFYPTAEDRKKILTDPDIKWQANLQKIYQAAIKQ